MKYMYAALLLHSASKTIDEENMKKVLAAAGVNIEEARVKALVAALSEVNIDEALKSLKSAQAVAPAPVTAPTTTEAKKEEKKPVEEKKEEALAGLGALFG
jgi:large subunit ribosomal protein L12